ncbi:unnamed protein product [Adineta ricciae]|uniref:Uncharacterized protein n=1 Tax=Adineta ricciae TaxID=249248 RepID=A0A813VHI2_ADIRI|nr:unnamed protein product [Adineta ricciae]
MGPSPSKEEMMRKSNPVKGKADEFYFACREGNLDYVKETLPAMTWEELNQLQPNGSTYLHVASHTGRTEIVRLLLQHGCVRSNLNLYGLTPYDEAWSEEIKVLFHRPRDERGGCRFVDNDIDETFRLTSSLAATADSPSMRTTMNEDDEQINEIDGDADFVINEWVETFNHFDKYSALMVGTIFKSNLFYRLVGLKRSSLHLMMDYVLSISLTENDRGNPAIYSILNEYQTRREIKSLLALYTHQSSFYTSLRDDSKCAAFTTLLYRNLSKIRRRFYKGTSYRGMKLQKKELSAYFSLSRHTGFALMNTKFQSSSKNKEVAKLFFNPADIPDDSNIREYMVLIEYHFLEPCESAIDLAPTVETNLSAYPHEQEVLILPHTLFELFEMKYDETTKTAIIRLKHIVPRGIFSSLRCAVKEFQTMTPEDLQQTLSRLERNVKSMMEFVNNSDN